MRAAFSGRERVSSRSPAACSIPDQSTMAEDGQTAPMAEAHEAPANDGVAAVTYKMQDLMAKKAEE